MQKRKESTRFYTLEQWKRRGETWTGGGSNCPLDLSFLQDADGNVVSSRRIKQIYDYSCDVWSQIVFAKKSPETWSIKSQDCGDFYFFSIAKAYPDEFLQADGPWKAEAFAKIKYPDFKRSKRKGLLELCDEAVEPGSRSNRLSSDELH